MNSASLNKFLASVLGAKILISFVGQPSAQSMQQTVTDQTLLRAAVAQAVGCWEGYIEEVLKEFVSKARVQSHRRAWTLGIQFESIVKKLTSELNTPSWDNARDLILNVTGMDPYASWVWSPRFSNQTDTKSFLTDVMDVRHSFAHGFATPHTIAGLIPPGQLNSIYAGEVLDCLAFLATTTDSLLEHELTHRHACNAGWS
jgi:RiboL-PSP-HEPN